MKIKYFEKVFIKKLIFEVISNKIHLFIHLSEDFGAKGFPKKTFYLSII